MMSTIRKFDGYFEPESRDELVRLLSEYGEDAYLLAGGTDLVPKLKTRAFRAKYVISLQSVKELSGIEADENGVFIGATTLLADVAKSPELRADYSAVAEAASHVSSMQIRNIGTIGGNACNASPGADALQGLLVMGAECMIHGTEGERQVPLRDFFTGPGKTILKKQEYLKGFYIARQKGFQACYEKFAIRGDTDLSIVGAGAGYQLGDDGSISGVRITLSAVAAIPMRAVETEAFLLGKAPSEALFKDAGEMAAGECSPITDQRATADYRKQVIAVSVKNALNRVMAKFQGLS